MLMLARKNGLSLSGTTLAAVCFCERIKLIERAAGKAAAVPLLPPRSAVNPFGPPTPSSSSPPKVYGPIGRTACRKDQGRNDPQSTRANPFHEPGEVPAAIVDINLSLNDGEEPADQPALSS
jgi:hypothetical protein